MVIFLLPNLATKNRARNANATYVIFSTEKILRRREKFYCFFKKRLGNV